MNADLPAGRERIRQAIESLIRRLESGDYTARDLELAELIVEWSEAWR